MKYVFGRLDAGSKNIIINKFPFNCVTSRHPAEKILWKSLKYRDNTLLSKMLLSALSFSNVSCKTRPCIKSFSQTALLDFPRKLTSQRENKVKILKLVNIQLIMLKC